MILRLATPGIIRGVLIDTSHFTGNFPPYASVEGATLLGYPSAEQLRNAAWTPLLAKSELAGDTENAHPIFAADHLSSHVRLRIYPDGGVARFRVHGEPLGDPRFLGGRGGPGRGPCTAAGSSAAATGFYSAPSHVLAPGRSSVMSDGWENARRRGRRQRLDRGGSWPAPACCTTS